MLTRIPLFSVHCFNPFFSIDDAETFLVTIRARKSHGKHGEHALLTRWCIWENYLLQCCYINARRHVFVDWKCIMQSISAKVARIRKVEKNLVIRNTVGIRGRAAVIISYVSLLEDVFHHCLL